MKWPWFLTKFWALFLLLVPLVLQPPMARSSAFFTLLIAVINAGVAFAGIGPATTLTISNGNVGPDGFTRAATLTNGQIDGPLITAQKVGEHLHNV